MAKSKIKTKPVKLRIECLVTEDDLVSLNKRAKELHARKGHLIADLEDKVKEIRARHRAESKAETSKLREDLRVVSKELGSCQNQIFGGTTFKDVACEERADFETGIVSVIRLDTKDIVSRRPLNQEERQLDIEDTAL